MGKKDKKSVLTKIPAVGLSLMTFFASLFLAFLFDRISSTEMSVFSTTEIIPMIFYVIVIAGASFFICRTHPKSVWHTPFICNALGMLSGIFGALGASEDPSFRLNSSFWIVVGGCLLLSVIGSIIGAQMGKRVINQAK